MNKFNDIYKGNGALTEEGEEFLAPVKQSLKDLFKCEEAQNMSEAQLRVLGSTIFNMVGNIVSDTIQKNQMTMKQFNNMTDMQFKEYLQAKYGVNWLFVSLTPVEFARSSRKNIG